MNYDLWGCGKIILDFVYDIILLIVVTKLVSNIWIVNLFTFREGYFDLKTYKIINVRGLI